MKARMNLIDTLFSDKEPKEAVPCSKQFTKSTGIVNFRDKLGRTALHMAVAFGNKMAAETLLYLGANPHIEDVFGQRPIEINFVDSLTSLLEVKMQQIAPPSQTQLSETTKSNGS